MAYICAAFAPQFYSKIYLRLVTRVAVTTDPVEKGHENLENYVVVLNDNILYKLKLSPGIYFSYFSLWAGVLKLNS